jgi:NADPH2:quinone reductase
MRTWLVKNWCEPEGMEWAEVDVPQPKAGEVRVKNRASALNFFDILQIQGKYQIKPPFPFTPGAEISGEIDAIGDGVTGWKKGDRVLGFPGGSGFAEQTVLDAAKVFRIPNGMDWAQAAAMPIVYHTSFFALKDRAELRAGEWLLVHAGASGVGMSAIQIGKASGATSGRGADVIYDPVGGDVFDLSSKCIASGGRLLVIGFASGRIPSIAVNRILLKNMSVVGVFWGNHVKANPTYTAETQKALETLWNEGKIKPEVSNTWPLAELPQAMKGLAERRVLGKAVLLS